MSNFSNALRVALESANITQALLSQESGVTQGQISKYIAGSVPPMQDQLDKLCEVFPEQERGALAAAYLKDRLPKSARALVIIEPIPTRLEESPAETRRSLPRDLRRAFDFLEAAAVANPDVAEAIKAAYKVLDPTRE